MTPTNPFRLCVLLAASLGAGAAHSAQLSEAAQGGITGAETPAAIPGLPATMIDENLSSRSIRVIAIEERQVMFIDEQQRRRTMPRDSILALIPVHDAAAPAKSAVPARTPEGVLELIDGQRLVGDLAAARANEASERITWNHPALGTLSYPLEQVSSFWRPGVPLEQRASARTEASSDAVLLSNGDRLRGFLASLGEIVQVESEGNTVDLAPDRIAGATLSNPPESPQGAWVWLSDGTAAEVERMLVELPGRVSLALANGQAGSFEWSQVRAVLMDSSRLRPLSSLELVSQKPVEGRRYAAPLERIALREHDPSGILRPPLDAYNILLPGPMEVVWTLPKNARRLALTARLEQGAQPWGDCDIVVLIDGTEALRRRLQTGQPSAPINLPISGESLAIRIEAGKYGPIRDRVILERAMVGVE